LALFFVVVWLENRDLLKILIGSDEKHNFSVEKNDDD
jgi:hypothetical protein